MGATAREANGRVFQRAEQGNGARLGKCMLVMGGTRRSFQVHNVVGAAGARRRERNYIDRWMNRGCRDATKTTGAMDALMATTDEITKL
jgi:hypothetical protein